MWSTPRNSSHTTPEAIEQALVPYHHASAAFQSLIQSIAESTSREDERRIVSDECARLRTELAQPHQPTELAEMLVRAIYCEMFGAPAPLPSSLPWAWRSTPTRVPSRSGTRPARCCSRHRTS